MEPSDAGDLLFPVLSPTAVLLHLSPSAPLPVPLSRSPSFSHWMVGGGVPWARHSSWTLWFSRTPMSLGISEPEILGGTGRPRGRILVIPEGMRVLSPRSDALYN